MTSHRFGDIVEPRRRDGAEITADDARGQSRSRNAVRRRAGAPERTVGVLNDIQALRQPVGQLRVEGVRTVRPALRSEEVVAPAGKERQIAAETAGQTDEIARLMAVVDAEVGKDTSGDRTRERVSPQTRWNERVGDLRSGRVRSRRRGARETRIIDRQLKLSVLLRLTTGHQQVAIELTVAEEVGVVSASHVTRVVPRRRDEILLKRRRRERVTIFQAAGETVVTRIARARSTGR